MAITFLENWSACPSDAALAQYTHIMISFAVTYTWNPSGNICDQACTLGGLLGCENKANVAELVQRAHRLGVQVLVSLGGAGQGGSWNLSTNRCWDPCIDKADYLADQVRDMVSMYDLDGVDVDYEDVLDTEERRSFLRDLTLGLRRRLGPNKLLTHTPMDSALDRGDPYYQVLEENSWQVAEAIDLLMPQYYNGFIKTHSQFPAASAHFADLVDLYDGDASRVVFGFCVNDCGGFNVDAAQAVRVLEQLDQDHPGNGGFFFWSLQKGDLDGSFTRPLLEYYASRDTLPPTDSQPTPQPPTPFPSTPPTPPPSAAPTVEPSAAPTQTPTLPPSDAPTQSQPNTNAPTAVPTQAPTLPPSADPTADPTPPPSSAPPTGGSSCSLPVWVDGQVYTQGDEVARHGIKYVAKWWTQSDDPTTNTGSGKPWLDAGSCIAAPPTPATAPPSMQPGDCAHPEWEDGQTYVNGDTVQRHGVQYTAQWWNRSQDPATNTGSGLPWRDDGPCN